MSTTFSPDQMRAPATAAEPDTLAGRPQSLASKTFEQVGILVTGFNKLNVSPLGLRRLGAATLATIVVGAATLHETVPQGDSANSAPATPELTTAYPNYSVDQLRALPDQKHVTAKSGDGERALIDQADPGLLTSGAAGRAQIVGELTQIIDAETRDGRTIRAGDGYSVPVVPLPNVVDAKDK